MAQKSTPKSADRNQQADNGVISFTFDDVKAGWERWVCLMADVHWDNPKCQRALLKKDLEKAVALNAHIVMTGDIYCLMQGKYDPRQSKGDTLPEHNAPSYLNKILTTSVSYFSPYAKNILMISYGNHETSVTDRCGFDMIEGLVTGLNAADNDACVLRGNYTGYIRFNFRINKTKQQSVLWYYTHGHGGGGEVTKGVLQAGRRAVYNPDARIVSSGHIHEQWVMNYPRYRVSSTNKTYLDSQVHIQTGTYKEEYNDGKPSYHILKGRPPKPLGCTFFRFFYDRGKIKMAVETEFDMSSDLNSEST